MSRLESSHLYFYSHKKGHSLPGISEKKHIKANFQKTEFVKYTSRVCAFSFTSIYLQLFNLSWTKIAITAVKDS